MLVNIIGVSMLAILIVSAIGVVVGIVNKNKRIYIPFLILLVIFLAVYVANLYFAVR